MLRNEPIVHKIKKKVKPFIFFSLLKLFNNFKIYLIVTFEKNHTLCTLYLAHSIKKYILNRFKTITIC